MKMSDIIRKKLLKVFTREFPVVGTMTSMAKSEEQCKQWQKRMNFCCWENSLFTFGDNVEDPVKLSVMALQVEQAEKNSEKITSQIKADSRYQYLLAEGKDCLVPDSQDDVEVTARVTDDSGEMTPLVAVSYLSHGIYVWIAIQDGEVSAFTAMEE